MPQATLPSSSDAGHYYVFTKPNRPLVTRALFLGNLRSTDSAAQDLIRSLCTAFGPLETDVHVGGPSRAYVVFQHVDHAVAAYLGLRERASQLKELSDIQLDVKYSCHKLVPLPPPPPPVAFSTEGLLPGLYLYHDYISVEQERALLEAVDQRPWVMLSKRRVQHYGHAFDYVLRKFSEKLGSLPSWVTPISSRFCSLPGMEGTEVDQLTVNEYPPGVGLAPHIDTHSSFEGPVVILSLGSYTIMEFRNGADHRPLLLPRRSLLVLIDEARHAWQHYIPSRKTDIVPNLPDEASIDAQRTRAAPAANAPEYPALMRDKRTSFTFRKIRTTPCTCRWPEHCDGQNSAIPPTRLAVLQGLVADTAGAVGAAARVAPAPHCESVPQSGHAMPAPPGDCAATCAPEGVPHAAHERMAAPPGDGAAARAPEGVPHAAHERMAAPPGGDGAAARTPPGKGAGDAHTSSPSQPLSSTTSTSSTTATTTATHSPPPPPQPAASTAGSAASTAGASTGAEPSSDGVDSSCSSASGFQARMSSSHAHSNGLSSNAARNGGHSIPDSSRVSSHMHAAETGAARENGHSMPAHSNRGSNRSSSCMHAVGGADSSGVAGCSGNGDVVSSGHSGEGDHGQGDGGQRLGSSESQPSTQHTAQGAGRHAGVGSGGSDWRGDQSEQSQCGQLGRSEQRGGSKGSHQHGQDDAALRRMEEQHVHAVYDIIAQHFSATRFAIWPRVRAFIDELQPGSVVADVGCGNGKYFGVRHDIAVLGSDRSGGLVEVAARRLQPGALQVSQVARADVFQADALQLPYRTGSCDAALCVAVLHHISSEARRLHLMAELLRILRPGGKAIVTVWAAEQEDPSKTLKKWHSIPPPGQQQPSSAVQRNGASDAPSASAAGVGASQQAAPDTAPDGRLSSVGATEAGGVEGPPPSSSGAGGGHRAGGDYFVPWHVPFHRAGAHAAAAQQSSCAQGAAGVAPQETPVAVDQAKQTVVYQRYYHLFVEGELEQLASRLEGGVVVDAGYDKSNWLVVLQKQW